MFLLNSRLGQLSATPFSYGRGAFTYLGHIFFRSYDVILPSSYPRNHSRTFGYSPRPPVSVYGTSSSKTHYEVFLGSVESISYPLSEDLRPHQLSMLAARRVYLPDPSTTLDQHIHRLADLSSCVTPSFKRL